MTDTVQRPRVTVTHLPAELHAILKRKAREDGVLLSTLIRDVLTTGMRVKRILPVEDAA